MTNSKSTPPKAQLALRIGVTGHRANRLAQADQAPLSARIRETVERIRNTVFADEKVRAVYDSEKPPLLRVISPLAEGSDRLVAHVALDMGCDLQCPLPFQRDDYAKDFASAASQAEYRDLLNQASAVFELDGSRETPEAENEAYLAVGRMVLKHCDVLIAIWDGQPPEGRGGTGQIVAEALRLQIPPIVWIKSQTPFDACYLQLDDNGNRQELSLAKLSDRVAQILLPPKPPNLSDPDLRTTYFAERQRHWTLLGPLFKVFLNLVNRGRPGTPQWRLGDFEAAARHNWQEEWQVAPDFPGAVAEQITSHYCPHYGWADQLADYYANRYRSSFLLSYLLSGCAVLFALLSHVSRPCGQIFIKLELVTIIFIFVLIICGRKCRWHERWIDYRLLAEQFRQMLFLAPLGHTTPAFQLPAHDTYDDPGNSWINWHFRAIIRAAGLFNARLEQRYLQAYRALLSGAIKGQVNYHEGKSEDSHNVAHRLHWIGIWFFAAVLITCLVHLTFPHELQLHELVEEWATLLAAVLPAFGAALGGILSQSEFERIAKRSKAMQEQLQKIVDKLDKAPLLSSKSLGERAEEAAEIMTSEVLDWRVVFRAKPLGLPG